MKIRVTQDHIDKGVKSNAKECPIALALNTCFGGYHSVGVLSFGRSNCFSKSLPKEAMKFIRDFDNGLLVNPFEFEIVGLIDKVSTASV